MKAALGCAIGCGAFALLAVIGGAIAAWWWVTPGKQRPTLAIASREAAGAFQVGDLGADPGVTALLDHVLLETQRRQQQGMPPWMRQLQRANGGSPSTGLRMLLPRQATFALEPSGQGDVAAWILALNPRGLTRLFHTFLPDGAVTGTHRGYELVSFGSGSHASLVDGTILVSNDEATLRAGIDRLLEGEAVPPPPPPDLGAPVRGWDLAGTVDNRGGTLDALLFDGGEVPGGEVPGIERALVGLDVASRDLAAGRVVVECSDRDAVALAVEALRRRAAERAATLSEQQLELRSAVRTEGSRAVLDWEVRGVAAAASRWLALNVENQPGS
jgi:hypothetical protein